MGRTLRKIWWYINHSLDWLAYVVAGGAFVGLAIIEIFEMTGLNNWFDSIEPKGLRFFWLTGTSAGIAFFLILFKKYYYKEPFFIKYPSAEELAEIKARTTEANAKFDKVMSADDTANSSRPSAATSWRTHNAKGR